MATPEEHRQVIGILRQLYAADKSEPADRIGVIAPYDIFEQTVQQAGISVEARDEVFLSLGEQRLIEGRSVSHFAINSRILDDQIVGPPQSPTLELAPRLPPPPQASVAVQPTPLSLNLDRPPGGTVLNLNLDTPPGGTAQPMPDRLTLELPDNFASPPASGATPPPSGEAYDSKTALFNDRLDLVIADLRQRHNVTDTPMPTDEIGLELDISLRHDVSASTATRIVDALAARGDLRIERSAMAFENNVQILPLAPDRAQPALPLSQPVASPSVQPVAPAVAGFSPGLPASPLATATQDGSARNSDNHFTDKYLRAVMDDIRLRYEVGNDSVPVYLSDLQHQIYMRPEIPFDDNTTAPQIAQELLNRGYVSADPGSTDMVVIPPASATALPPAPTSSGQDSGAPQSAVIPPAQQPLSDPQVQRTEASSQGSGSAALPTDNVNDASSARTSGAPQSAVIPPAQPLSDPQVQRTEASSQGSGSAALPTDNVNDASSARTSGAPQMAVSSRVSAPASPASPLATATQDDDTADRVIIPPASATALPPVPTSSGQDSGVSQRAVSSLVSAPASPASPFTATQDDDTADRVIISPASATALPPAPTSSAQDSGAPQMAVISPAQTTPPASSPQPVGASPQGSGSIPFPTSTQTAPSQNDGLYQDVIDYLLNTHNPAGGRADIVIGDEQSIIRNLELAFGLSPETMRAQLQRLQDDDVIRIYPLSVYDPKELQRIKDDRHIQYVDNPATPMIELSPTQAVTVLASLNPKTANQSPQQTGTSSNLTDDAQYRAAIEHLLSPFRTRVDAMQPIGDDAAVAQNLEQALGIRDYRQIYGHLQRMERDGIIAAQPDPNDNDRILVAFNPARAEQVLAALNPAAQNAATQQPPSPIVAAAVADPDAPTPLPVSNATLSSVAPGSVGTAPPLPPGRAPPDDPVTVSPEASKGGIYHIHGGTNNFAIANGDHATATTNAAPDLEALKKMFDDMLKRHDNDREDEAGKKKNGLPPGMTPSQLSSLNGPGGQNAGANDYEGTAAPAAAPNPNRLHAGHLAFTGGVFAAGMITSGAVLGPALVMLAGGSILYAVWRIGKFGITSVRNSHKANKAARAATRAARNETQTVRPLPVVRHDIQPERPEPSGMRPGQQPRAPAA